MRLLALVNDVQSATSFYRSIGPLTALQKDGFDLTLTANVAQIDWPTLYFYDAVYMERPYSKANLDAAKMVKDLGIPLWLDYDDDLFSVPETNPAYSLYNAPLVQDTMRELLNLSDVVTVTTLALLERLSIYAKKVMIIPNAVDERVLRWQHQPGPRQANVKVLWRGGNTHRRDLQSVTEEIVRVAEKYPKVEWHFLGNEKPWYITERLKGAVNTPGGFHLMNYFKVMSQLSPDIVIVPLEDNIFNRSKSNIAWLEATIAGAMCIAPAMPEWDKPGCLTYMTPQGFENVLSNSIDGDHIAANLVWSLGYIQENLMLKKVNESRRKLLMELVR